MKISNETIEVLKNFSTIYPGIYIQKGNVLSSISEGKSVLGVAEVEESFDRDFAIYDISSFLTTLGLVGEPEIDFGDEMMVVTGPNSSFHYLYTDKENVKYPAKNEIKLPDVVADFDVDWKSLNSVIKACGVMQLPTVVFEGKDGEVSMYASDTTKPKSNKFMIKVGDHSGDDFKLLVKVENFRLLPLDYNVKVSVAGLVQLTSEKIKYWVTADAK